MAYQEIVAPATPAAVIDAVRAFAEQNGWTVMRNTLSGSNRTLTLKRPGSDYIHIYNTALTSIYLRGSIDYVEATAPDSTATRGPRALTNVGAGPYTKLFLFAGDSPAPYIHFVIEANAAGNYWHSSFGVIDKFEEFVSGTYYDGHYWTPPGTTSGTPHQYSSASYPLFGGDNVWYTPTGTTMSVGGVRCDIPADGITNSWAQFSDTNGASDTTRNIATGLVAGSATQSSTYDNELTQKANAFDDNIFSNRSIFHRIMASVRRPGGFWSPIGVFTDVRLCSVAKFTPGQEVTIGTDVWKVFPMLRKGSVGTPLYERYSQNYGYAYRKIP